MYNSIILICLISFSATFFLAPRFKVFLEESGILGIDQHKKNKPRIASSGGLCVAFGLLGGIMSYIALNTFLLNTPINLSYLLAASCTILIVTLVGVLDDLNIKQNVTKHATGTDEYRAGLRQWVKPVLTLPGAIPTRPINRGLGLVQLLPKAQP